ncbi:plasmid mobilization relaxosome protein MobC [Campylobacter sp. 9BO]|uniref:plasmid mobilization relaxosome protein MobC n=1 Tax=Campylobacter sp. 9BO TaxID=3424759 RepID=UPI003D32DD38
MLLFVANFKTTYSSVFTEFKADQHIITALKIIKNATTKELILELSRQGNNLNQIAYKLNKGESLDRVDYLPYQPSDR